MGEGPVVGDEIAGHPGTDAVGFTSSAETGVAIARRAAGQPLLLEMGGNGPVVVLDDADLQAAARALRVAEGIRTGIVNVNDTSNYWELHIPFGCMSGKRSGIGRLGGAHTLKEITDLKTICLDVG